MQTHCYFCQGNSEAPLVFVGWLRCQYIQFCPRLLGPMVPFGTHLWPPGLSCILIEVGFHTALIALTESAHFVAWREALLNVSGFLLAAEDGYNSKGCWYFKTKIC
jgi:hypothetical protein